MGEVENTSIKYRFLKLVETFLNLLRITILFIIKWRYLIALIVFVLCVAFKIHGSSINEYNKIFDHYADYESQSVLVGKSRPVRSDEWLVHTPSYISQSYNDFEKDNSLISLEGEDMIVAHNAPIKNVSLIAKPFTWGYVLLGNEYGLSWYWCSKLILLILLSFEACMILTRKNKKVALLGAIMVAFSPAVQWWFVPHAVDVFFWGLALFVTAYHFFVTDRFLRWLFMVLVSLSAITFVMALYPPLQIPIGLVMLVLLIVCLIRDKEDITFKKKDIWRIVAMALFVIGVLAWTIWESKDAIMTLYNTVYPGKRVSLGGTGGIEVLFTDPTSFLLPFREITYSNSPEISTFIHFAPIFLILYPTIWKKMKKEKNMIVGNALLICIVIMAVYMMVGSPELLAKLTLFSYIGDARMKLAYGLVGVLFTIWGIDMVWKKQLFSRKQIIFTLVIFGFCYICFVGNKELSYAGWKYYIAVAFGLMALGYLMLRRYGKTFLTLTAALVLAAGATVNPIARGISPLISHPLEQKVHQIAESDGDAHWLALNSMSLQQIGIANGAKMLNAANFYPDYGKWKITDPEGKYDDVYNRYAYIIVALTDGETKYTPGATPDIFRLDLSCQDALKWPTKYLLSAGENTACKKDFKEIYVDTEGNYHIYERVGNAKES